MIVGNIGSVYSGTSESNALLAYEEYVNQSTLNYGRAAGESVILMVNDHPWLEHEGTVRRMSLESMGGFVDRIDELMQRWADSSGADLTQHCIAYSVTGQAVLCEMGIKAQITAGTMMWPRIDMTKDDGVSATHFSYVFEPQGPVTKARLAADLLPEMHAWITLPDRKEILDLTTRHLKVQCERTAGLPWLGPDPPKFLWCDWSKLPAHVHYEPHPDAIKIIYRKLIGEK